MYETQHIREKKFIFRKVVRKCTPFSLFFVVHRRTGSLLLEREQKYMYYKRRTGAIVKEEPEKTYNWVKWVHQEPSEKHCEECLKLDGCLFREDNHPIWPQHPHCHCVLEQVDYKIVEANASANSAYSKFDPYLFNTTGLYTHGKEKLFKLWGYSSNDSSWLKAEMEQQALSKYLSGNYKLGRLDKNGQRINIRIAIVRRDTGEVVTFMSGWMARANGQLQLITPYGDD